MNTRILMLMIICILTLILASASVDMSGTVPVYNVYTVYYYVSSICTVGCVILSENPNFNFGI